MSIALRVIIACVAHPRYRGIGKPRTRCGCCEAIYAARHDTKQFSDVVFGDENTDVNIQVLNDGQDVILGSKGGR